VTSIPARSGENSSMPIPLRRYVADSASLEHSRRRLTSLVLLTLAASPLPPPPPPPPPPFFGVSCFLACSALLVSSPSAITATHKDQSINQSINQLIIFNERSATMIAALESITLFRLGSLSVNKAAEDHGNSGSGALNNLSKGFKGLKTLGN